MLESMRMLNADVKYAWPEFLYLGSMEEMGDRIKQCRTLRGLTLEQVAKEIGITASALSLWENGQTKNLRPENILNFCAFFGVDPYVIVFGKPLDKSSTGKFRRLSHP
jgi:transcriptional regulator with XRE-family HTH domain